MTPKLNKISENKKSKEMKKINSRYTEDFNYKILN